MSGRELVLSLLRDGVAARPPVMPITMMFAAEQLGCRYRDYVSDYRVLAEAQLRTAERFGFDFVSVISDPAREAHDLGAAILFFDQQPPAVDESQALLADKEALARLGHPDPEAGRMGDRLRGVRLLRERAGRELLVEGWVEGPCAEAADLRGINTLMLDFLDDPGFVHDLLDRVTELAIRFATAQLAAGAEIIGVGDAAASLVGPEIYETFVLPREKRLVAAIHAAGGLARLHICGNITALLPWLGEVGADILDLDSMVPMATARAQAGPQQVLLGNLDPVRIVRNGTPELVRQELAACRAAAGGRYIAGAGCEIPPGTPGANVRAFAAWARSLL
ncbi:MAG: uroporphyrinogen decarboxylase family protein [Lentisphaeria bacterium]|jgi:MtaA/CmuA family methyltransferase